LIALPSSPVTPPLLRPLAAAILALPALAAGASGQAFFVDLAPALGIENESFGRGVALADLDGDGREEVICANAGMPNLVYYHKPDGTFAVANQALGVPVDALASWAVLATDFDGDGDNDIFFANGAFEGSEPNTLLRNDGDSGLTDVSAQAGDVISSKTTGPATLAIRPRTRTASRRTRSQSATRSPATRSSGNRSNAP